VAILNLENVKFGLGDHDFTCGQHKEETQKKLGVFSFYYRSVGLVQAFEIFHTSLVLVLGLKTEFWLI
jgi:hypothetical protein